MEHAGSERNRRAAWSLLTLKEMEEKNLLPANVLLPAYLLRANTKMERKCSVGLPRISDE